MKSLKTIIILSIVVSGCVSNPVARPNGFMRIGMPEKTYSPIQMEGCPFSSSLNSSAKILYKDSANCWIDIVYPTLLSTIQLTYKPVENNLQELFMDAQKLAYKHTVKATGMREQVLHTIVLGYMGCIMKCLVLPLPPHSFMQRTALSIS